MSASAVAAVPLQAQNLVQNIAVVAIQLDNLGDISGAQKISEMVRTSFPQSNVSLAFLPHEFNEMQKLFLGDYQPIDSKEVKRVFPGILDEADLRKKIDSIGLLILFPICQLSDVPKMVSDCGKPYIYLGEYGSGITKAAQRGELYPLGLAKNEIGVLFPEDLNAYYHQNKGQTSLEKLSCLSLLPKGLQGAILGESYTLERTRSFDATSKLYMAYAQEDRNDSFSDYLSSLCELSNPEQNYDVTVCLLTKYDNEKITQILKGIHAALFRNRFKTTQVFEVNDRFTKKQKDVSFHEKAKGKRNLKIIFCKLTQPEVVALLKSSQDEVLTTGDQSFMEAMALRKVIGYSLESHKIDFMESFVNLASAKNKDLGDLFSKACFGSDSVKKLKDLREAVGCIQTNDVQKGLSGLFSQLKNKPHLKQVWEEFIQKIHDDHHCRPQLEKLISQGVSLANRSLRVIV